MQSAEPRTRGGETQSRRLPLWLLSLGSGLLGGLLAGFVAELTYGAIHREPVYPALFDSMSGSERAAARARLRYETSLAVQQQQATAAYGMLGLALASVLGLTGGLAGGSKRAPLAGAVGGGILGGLAGAGLSMVLVPVFFELSGDYNRVLLLLLTHLAIFAGVGAIGGLAFGWGLGDRKAMIRCMFGGLVGALVGSFVSEVSNAVAFPLWHMYEPVPVKTRPRLLVHLWVAAGTAVGAGLAAGKLRRDVDSTRLNGLA